MKKLLDEVVRRHRLADVAEGGGEVLEPTRVLGDGQIALLKVVELPTQVKPTGRAVGEEVPLDAQPDIEGSGVVRHDDVEEAINNNGMVPQEHGDVHPAPLRVVRVGVGVFIDVLETIVLTATEREILRLR